MKVLDMVLVLEWNGGGRLVTRCCGILGKTDGRVPEIDVFPPPEAGEIQEKTPLDSNEFGTCRQMD